MTGMKSRSICFKAFVLEVYTIYFYPSHSNMSRRSTMRIQSGNPSGSMESLSDQETTKVSGLANPGAVPTRSSQAALILGK